SQMHLSSTRPRLRGRSTVSQEAGKMPLPPQAELQWWYQFYFATERGRLGYDKYRKDFSRLIWQLASPKRNFGDAAFDRSAAAFDNPDHVAIVIHIYRWRLGWLRAIRNVTSFLFPCVGVDRQYGYDRAVMGQDIERSLANHSKRLRPISGWPRL